VPVKATGIASRGLIAFGSSCSRGRQTSLHVSFSGKFEGIPGLRYRSDGPHHVIASDKARESVRARNLSGGPHSFIYLKNIINHKP